MRYNEPDNMELGLGFARQSKSARGARRHARVYLPNAWLGLLPILLFVLQELAWFAAVPAAARCNRGVPLCGIGNKYTGGCCFNAPCRIVCEPGD